MSKWLVILMLTGNSLDFTDIGKINELKKQAETAFKKGDFVAAIENYSYLLDTLAIDDESATMNLAHAYYQSGKPDLAQSRYQKLVLSKDANIKSLAYQQLGALSKDPKTLERALAYFKESIKSDPTNEDARYNYELVKKKLKEQEDNQDKDQKEDENQDKQEPSDWAKELKKKADQMVSFQRYTEAHNLMNEGLKKDATVQHYADFIKRLGEVSEINNQ